MKSKRITSAITTIVFIGMLLFPDYIQAQVPSPENSQSLSQPHNFDSGFNFGVSVNYGGLYFDNEFSNFNDFYKSSVGYGFHVLYPYSLSPVFSLSTGVTVFVNRYSAGENRGIFTDESGEPTGTESVTTMAGTAGTTYAGLPVNLVIRPLANKSIYATIGPEVGYRVAHNNDAFTTRLDPVPEEGDPYWGMGDEDGVISVVSYINPEQSRRINLFVNAGFGYSFDEDALPLDITLGVRQAVTTYMGDDNFIDSWLRHLTFTVSYRL